jgi:16S rRNA (adenine1518-N6/adenine1519-N6)-dimethyltransferase
MTILSVAAQVLAEPKSEFSVAPGSFLPPPKVESTVVSLDPLGEQRLAASRRPLFFEIVNGGFRHKRKQILNSLAFECDLPKDAIASRLTNAGIDPMRRAQTLSVDEWLSLLDAWEREA